MTRRDRRDYVCRRDGRTESYCSLYTSINILAFQRGRRGEARRCAIAVLIYVSICAEVKCMHVAWRARTPRAARTSISPGGSRSAGRPVGGGAWAAQVQIRTRICVVCCGGYITGKVPYLLYGGLLESANLVRG